MNEAYGFIYLGHS